MARLSPVAAVAILALLVLAAAAPAPAPAATCPGASVPSNLVAAPTARKAVLCLVNRERRRHTLPAYRRAALLELAAQRHSRDMVRRRFFEHVSPDGSTPGVRVRRTGWLDRSAGWALGEAIAWGGGAYATPAKIVDMWMHSPPHRAILLDQRFRFAGIGIASGTPTGMRPGATFTLDAGLR